MRCGAPPRCQQGWSRCQQGQSLGFSWQVKQASSEAFRRKHQFHGLNPQEPLAVVRRISTRFCTLQHQFAVHKSNGRCKRNTVSSNAVTLHSTHCGGVRIVRWRCQEPGTQTLPMGLPYMPTLGVLGGQCRHICHTWSVWGMVGRCDDIRMVGGARRMSDLDLRRMPGAVSEHQGLIEQ